MNINDEYKDLVNYYDQRLPGQEQTVKEVIMNLKLRDVYAMEKIRNKGQLFTPPLNLLVRGSSGSGKTHAIKTICATLGIPFVAVNITDFTSSGYVGSSLADILKSLTEAAEPYARAEIKAEKKLKEQDQPKPPPGKRIKPTPKHSDDFNDFISSILRKQSGGGKDDSEAVRKRAKMIAQTRGVVMLDEIDKILMSTGQQYNIGTSGIVREILTYLSGSIISSSEHGSFDTTNVIFICAGAFDLVKFSAIPTELLGRLPTRIVVNDPTKETFLKMIQSSVIDMWGGLNLILSNKGVGSFEIPIDVAEHMAETLERDEKIKPIGVRRLTTAVNDITKQYFVNDDIKNLPKLVLTKEVVDEVLSTIQAGLIDGTTDN